MPASRTTEVREPGAPSSVDGPSRPTPDDLEQPLVESADALGLDDDSDESTLHERDAVEGPSIDELLEPLDDEGDAAGDEGDLVESGAGEGIDEAPDDGALGDDDDGLGDDDADLDESLLAGEHGDDGADGLEADGVELADREGPSEAASDDDGGSDDPVLLPELPAFDR